MHSKDRIAWIACACFDSCMSAHGSNVSTQARDQKIPEAGLLRRKLEQTRHDSWILRGPQGLFKWQQKPLDQLESLFASWTHGKITQELWNSWSYRSNTVARSLKTQLDMVYFMWAPRRSKLLVLGCNRYQLPQPVASPGSDNNLQLGWWWLTHEAAISWLVTSHHLLRTQRAKTGHVRVTTLSINSKSVRCWAVLINYHRGIIFFARQQACW